MQAHVTRSLCKHTPLKNLHHCTCSCLTKSPRPRMRSPSVITVTLTSASGQLSITWCQGKGRLLASESSVCLCYAAGLAVCLPAALLHNTLPQNCASAEREGGAQCTDLPHFATVMD